MSNKDNVIAGLKDAFGYKDRKAGQQENQYEEYYIESRKYGRLTPIGDAPRIMLTPEEILLSRFIETLKRSTLQRSWECASKASQVYESTPPEMLTETPLYKIAKEYTDKSLLLPDGVKKNMLLAVAIDKYLSIEAEGIKHV